MYTPIDLHWTVQKIKITMCALGSPMTKFLKTEIPYNCYFSRLKLEFRALTVVSFIYKSLMAMNKNSAWRDQILNLSGLQTVSFTPPPCCVTRCIQWCHMYFLTCPRSWALIQNHTTLWGPCSYEKRAVLSKLGERGNLRRVPYTCRT